MTTTMSESDEVKLVAQARRYADKKDSARDGAAGIGTELLRLQADTIERLVAENERLKAERDELMNANGACGLEAAKQLSRATDFRLRAEAADAQVAHMREAILWADGQIGEWPERQPGEGAFYWRKELMRRAALSPEEMSAWQPIDANAPLDGPPFDGRPVLIFTNNCGSDDSRIHRVRWSDEIHGTGIFGWVVDDCKHGPFPLRGYTVVTHWQPLPEPPK